MFVPPSAAGGKSRRALFKSFLSSCTCQRTKARSIQHPRERGFQAWPGIEDVMPNRNTCPELIARSMLSTGIASHSGRRRARTGRWLSSPFPVSLSFLRVCITMSGPEGLANLGLGGGHIDCLPDFSLTRRPRLRRDIDETRTEILGQSAI